VQCNDTAKQTSDNTTYLMLHQEEDLTISSLAYLNLYNITYLLITKRNSQRPLRQRYHFVREFVDSGFIKIEFVRSVENNSDLFTKNVNQELYEKHKTNFLVDSEEFGAS
jgi:hypothetical protein